MSSTSSPPHAHRWVSPLDLKLVQTDDSHSYQRMPPHTTGVPTGAHPGAFAFERKNHVHEGVDLYCPEGSTVYAVEAGVVVAVLAFTGPLAGMAWWEDTQVVLVEGATGVVAYGEVVSGVSTSDIVHRGDKIGTVKRVLRKDKGRPMSMLHLELHMPGARSCPEWTKEKGRPQTLLDPTPYLLQLTQ